MTMELKREADSSGITAAESGLLVRYFSDALCSATKLYKKLSYRRETAHQLHMGCMVS